MTARPAPRRALGLSVALFSAVTTGCGFSVRLDSCPASAAPTPPPETSLSVQYLGVGGFLLRRGPDTLLTAPMYSNPSLVEVLAEHALRPDPRLIEQLLPRPADQALGILVGHAHYDHLLDLPYVATRRARQARIYGSRTVARLLAFDPSLAARVVTVEDVAGDHLEPGQWLQVGPRVRVMPLRSQHSAQATLEVQLSRQRVPFHLWRGDQETELARAPRTASDYPEGEVFAYLVDFLDDAGQVLFRVYYQDSGTDEPSGAAGPVAERSGYPPRRLVDERRVDAALLCVGGDAQRLRNHPAGIIAWTRPRAVILGHWEDFFVTQDAYATDGRIHPSTSSGPLQGNEVEPFVRQARAALRRVDPAGQVWLPCPTRSRFVLPPAGATGRASSGG